jgi:hypothetical protein
MLEHDAKGAWKTLGEASDGRGYGHRMKNEKRAVGYWPKSEGRSTQEEKTKSKGRVKTASD